MQDEEILALFFQRSEDALTQTEKQYGALARNLAHAILEDPRDCEECVDDSYWKLWKTIPPQRPRSLKAYLCKIVRTTALDSYRYQHREKRFSPELSQISAEAEEISTSFPLDDQLALRTSIHHFLSRLSPRDRFIFVRRYFYFDSISQIAQGLKLPENTVKTILYKLRNSLRRTLREEGLDI